MAIQKKLLHIIMHIVGWVLLFLLPPLIIQIPVEFPDSFGDYMNWSFALGFFYLNYYLLVPRYLSKRRFFLYFSIILVMLTVCYFSNVIYLKHEYARHIQSEVKKENKPETRRKPPRFRSYNATLFCFALLALGTSIKVTQNWYTNEKEKKEMENQQLGAELSLLKSQINPHFFFNTLNSIYALAITKSDRTPEAVVKLSGIMRYIIYDTERKQVPLSKEVEYIVNYIELQQLRLPAEITVDLTTDLGTGDAVIEPLLLLPFVENAFKHGIDPDAGGIIRISITQKDTELVVWVENPLVELKENEKIEGGSGIGMQNTLKRLSLLYPGNHTFEAGPQKDTYRVYLRLKLKDNEMPDSG